jgi:sigma-B regulation protein RsbU (phosphoserine phosphatase)
MASGRFATFCYARVDTAGRRIVYSNAGHNPPLLIRAGGSLERLSEGGMVLGVFPDTAFEQGELPIGSGDRLLFYTDGITEARSPDGEEYGEDKLAAAALAGMVASVTDMKDAVLADVSTFTGGLFEDDATLIVVGIA